MGSGLALVFVAFSACIAGIYNAWKEEDGKKILLDVYVAFSNEKENITCILDELDAVRLEL